jgi:2-hydroxy-3-keto-5-methylthiopentenyl-1-phosphate phosphatase
MSSSLQPRKPGAGRLAVVADFDGTLTTKDLGERTLRRFGLPGWERYDELLEHGQITLDECIRRQSAMIRAQSQEAILRYISRFSRFRLGTDRLIEECNRSRIDFVVASAGIDFCIRQAFRLNELPTPRLVCPASTFTRKGLRIVMPARAPLAGRTRVKVRGYWNFKESLVATYQSHGRKVIYIGNGTTDIPPASIADKVFAISGSPLEATCVERGIPHSSIRTLLPVSKFVGTESFGL